MQHLEKCVGISTLKECTSGNVDNEESNSLCSRPEILSRFYFVLGG